MATDEEKLLDIVQELRVSLEMDMARHKEWDDDDDRPEVLYPTFCEAVKQKEAGLKKVPGYRELCCLPSFVLGLTMVGRVRRHYTHMDWFNVGQLRVLVKEHGGVRGCFMMTIRTG
jgi:hypothetical protein